jgi:endo-1,4-beta-xylanase
VIAQLGRREFLATASMAAAGAFGINVLPSPPMTMRSIAASKGLLFGTAVRDATIRWPQFAELVAAECSIVVPEGALKWDTLRPTREQFNFLPGEAYLQFAQSNKLLARGHTLVWHEAMPSWFSSTVNSGNARGILLDHISTVVQRFAGKIQSWDVVNEIVQISDGRPDGLRTSPWLRLVGPDYIEAAFHAAHDADPHAVLVYNEDQLEPSTTRGDVKRQRVLALLKDLQKKGTPIHALGVESHIPAEGFVGGKDFRRFLQEVSDLGLSIVITELDICDQVMVGNIEARDKVVAARYYDYLAFMLEFSCVVGVLTWGFSDRYTWLSGHSPRWDDLPVRPLPFDAELKPTEAWKAIQRAFEGAPSRSGWLPKAI